MLLINFIVDFSLILITLSSKLLHVFGRCPITEKKTFFFFQFTSRLRIRPCQIRLYTLHPLLGFSTLNRTLYWKRKLLHRHKTCYKRTVFPISLTIFIYQGFGTLNYTPTSLKAAFIASVQELRFSLLSDHFNCTQLKAATNALAQELSICFFLLMNFFKAAPIVDTLCSFFYSKATIQIMSFMKFNFPDSFSKIFMRNEWVIQCQSVINFNWTVYLV